MPKLLLMRFSSARNSAFLQLALKLERSKRSCHRNPLSSRQVSCFLVYFLTGSVQGEQFRIVGRLVANECTITLNYGYNHDDVACTKTILLKRSASVGVGDLVPRIWAQTKVD